MPGWIDTSSPANGVLAALAVPSAPIADATGRTSLTAYDLLEARAYAFQEAPCAGEGTC
jgi:hypothetical protein